MTARSPSLAELTGLLEATAGRLVDSTRGFSAAQWSRVVGGRSTADAVQALVTTVAEFEHAVEVAAAAPPDGWRSPAPAPYPAALPDRLAVVAHDLVTALRAAPDGHQVWCDAELVPIERLAAAAVAAVRATTAL